MIEDAKENQSEEINSSEAEAYPRLPSGAKFQAGSKLESHKGLRYTVQGLLKPSEGPDALVLMTPEVPDPDEPDMPQGEMLSQMGEWKVVRFEPLESDE